MDSALGMKGPAQLWKSKWWCIRLATAATPNGTQQFVHVLVLYACLKMAAHAPNTMNGVLGDVLLDQDSLRGNLVTSKRSSIRFRSDEPEDHRWHRFLHPPGTACTLSPHVVHTRRNPGHTAPAPYLMAVRVLLPGLYRPVRPSLIDHQTLTLSDLTDITFSMRAFHVCHVCSGWTCSHFWETQGICCGPATAGILRPTGLRSPGPRAQGLLMALKTQDTPSWSLCLIVWSETFTPVACWSSFSWAHPVSARLNLQPCPTIFGPFWENAYWLPLPEPASFGAPSATHERWPVIGGSRQIRSQTLGLAANTSRKE